jgi:TonB-like protein
MPRQSRAVLGFPLVLLSIFPLLNSSSTGQLDSNEQALESKDQTSGARVSCGVQATEILVLRTPGATSPIATVKCDEPITIIYDEVGFYKVQLGNVTKGYISQLFVTNPQQKPAHVGGPEGIIRHVVLGMTPPKSTHCPDPQFTPEARSAKYEGNIVLEGIITTEGNITYVHATQVSTSNKRVVGPQSLDRAWVSLEEAAIDSVKRSRFKPAYGADGKPVAVIVPIEVTFRVL